MDMQFLTAKANISKIVWAMSVFVITVLINNNSPAYAIQTFKKKVQKAVDNFEEAKTKANRKVIKQFAKYRKSIKRDGRLSEASRAEMLDRHDEYVSNFVESGELPGVLETVQLEMAYYEKLNKAYAPIANLLEAELKIANRNDDKTYTKYLITAKQFYESTLLKADRIDKDTVFKGTLTRPNGDTIPYKIQIESISESGDFEAIAHDNPSVRGHWKYRASGTCVGTHIQLSMSKNLNGKLAAVQLNGIIAGDRLLARLDQKTTKGKPTQNWLVLSK